MAYRSSKLFKALDKPEATTPQQVKDLLGSGEDPNLQDSTTGRGYLHKVVEMFEAPQEDEFLESQMIPSLISLVVAGANVNAVDNDGNTPLHVAFLLNSGAKVVNVLVKLSADVTAVNEHGQKVADLITTNTDPHMIKSLGLMIPGLCHAMEEDDLDKVTDLLCKWSKIDINVGDMSLIDKAKELGNEHIILALQQNWATNQFIYAAYQQDVRKMKKILKKEKINVDPKDPSYVDDEGQQCEMTLLGECLMLNLFDSAQFLLEKGAFINEPIKVGEETEPLYFYLMKNNPSIVFSPIFPMLVERADLKLVKKFSVGILYTGFISNWPEDIVEKLIDNGLDVTTRSDEGYTVRDNILVQVAFYPRKKRLEKLQHVDQHIIKLATDGNLERLKEMAFQGYTNLNIVDKKGKHCSYLAKKSGHKDVSEFLDSIGETFKRLNSLQEHIRQANLAKAREYLDEETAFMRDRGGRSPLHTAVLFERRFVIKYLTKTFPATVHIKDDYGRTPLHYACALPNGADIEDILSACGADDTIQDEFKKCPIDYKVSEEDDNFIEAERKKKCAHDIYLLEVYLNFADGIITDDFDLVRDTRDDLFEDVKMEEIIPNMYKATNNTPPGLLQMCLDSRRENIARYLIKNGVDMWENVRLQDEIMKFPIAVEKAGMKRLHEFLSKKIREDQDEEAKFKEAEANIRQTMTRSNSNDEDSEEDSDDEDGKSKACVIL